jgi:anti-sigma-K factor RskA
VSSLDALADELRRRARQVEAIGDELVHAAAVAIWTSVAADAFRAHLSRRRRDCSHVAGLLRSASSAVNHFSHDAELEKARLRHLEQTVAHDVGSAISFLGRL